MNTFNSVLLPAMMDHQAKLDTVSNTVSTSVPLTSVDYLFYFGLSLLCVSCFVYFTRFFTHQLNKV